MIAFHTVGSLGIRAGGPTRTVSSLCANLYSIPDVSVSLLTGVAEKFGPNDVSDRFPVIECDARSKSDWCRTLLDSIKQYVQYHDNVAILLHDHGQWLPINRASAEVSLSNNIPRIVTPRGMLSPWALSQRWLKKKIAWNLFAKRNLCSARAIHATSELESYELRRLGLRNPIAIIPNGVEVPPHSWIDYPKKKQLLFLSRLHPKKGVKELIDVWRALDPKDWDLILAGPDESNLIGTLKLDSNERIRWVGDIDGKEKWQLLAESALFVLPSYSENFGVVVAEALIAGTPVVTTRGTPWRSLEEQGCGWCVDMTPETLNAALQKAMQRDINELADMGQKGQHFASTKFGWPSIANEMHQVYEWVLNRGTLPKCVSLT